MTKGRKPKHDALRRPQKDGYGIQQPEGYGVQMPPEIAADETQARIWCFLVPPDNRFTDQDIPNLKMLTFWHAVAAQAQAAITRGDHLQLVEPIGLTQLKTPDGKQVPLVRKKTALGILKEASAEIRAYSDMLGLSPLARSRIGLMDATTVKTAADTAAMFQSIDAAYKLPESEVLTIEAHTD